MRGRIVGIHVAAADGAPMSGVASAECRADFGLAGDRYAKPGSGAQVTIVAVEQLATAAERLGAAIPPGATRRNVTIEGVALPGRGGRLIVGDAGAIVLEITGPADPCRIMERSVGPGARAALEGLAGMRARVVAGGMISVGDAVRAEPAAEERSA